MSLIFDYNIERENNIIKNIALEIVAECAQFGLEVAPELANYMVKVKLLDPKNGFTASDVMPRHQTQQLVALVIEDLKLFTPGMNCIRMQVFWSTLDINIAHLKNQFIKLLSEKAEPYLHDILYVAMDGIMKMNKLLVRYILTSHNLGNINRPSHYKETAAALYSVFKYKDAHSLLNLTDENKIKRIADIANRVAGIRLFLKYTGRAGEGIEEVKNLFTKIESIKQEVVAKDEKITARIKDLRKVIMLVIPMDFFEDVVSPGEVNLPPDCNADDLIHAKKILFIMLQHSLYLSDLMSKLDELDATVNIIFKKYNETLQKLQEVIKNREAVPTTDVYDNFNRTGELYLEIQGYSHCINVFRGIVKKLEHINKKHYFAPTKLEKALHEKLTTKHPAKEETLSKASEGSKAFSGVLILKGFEDFTLEFNGFCAMTLFYTEGLLLPGVAEAGIFQYKDQYFAFADRRRHEIWAKDPDYYLLKIYELLRKNPEMIYLLNAYDNLHYSKFHIQDIKVDKKVPVRTELTQTVLHPIEEYWDKDYTFSLWELKKQALALSRLVKCVTKSVQTFSPQSHYRASIGLLAAPDKDKEVQTKRDSSCNHSTISNYLYGLRGHREDKFKVIEFTRPVEETYEKLIVLEEGNPCEQRQQRRINNDFRPFLTTDDRNEYNGGGELSDQYTEQL